MRTLVILLALGLLAPSRAHAGACSECPAPSLVSAETEGLPTVKQAIAATKALLAGVRGKSAAKVGAALAIPFLYDLSGRALPDQGCYDGASYVDEAESMPGRPDCLIVTLAKTAKKLAGQATKKNVYASLAALEKKRGALHTPSRVELEPLAQHRLVYLAKGALKVIVAVRLAGGVAVVDAVIVEPPKGWTPREPELAPEPPSNLDETLTANGVKAGVGPVKGAILACGAKFPAAKGVVKLQVKVSPAGAVTDVTVRETPDAGLGRCAAAEMKHAAFAQTNVGGAFTYPFSF